MKTIIIMLLNKSIFNHYVIWYRVLVNYSQKVVAPKLILLREYFHQHVAWSRRSETIRTIFQVKHPWKMLSFSMYNFIFCCLWCKLSNAFVLHYQLFLHFVNGRLQPIKRKTPVDQFQSLHKSQLDYWNYNMRVSQLLTHIFTHYLLQVWVCY